MKLYLLNAENIYFPQIKEYFREIVSSYDNGNYRSAMVMLYSTIVCDLLLKLKELSDVYSDEKAEKILNDIDKKRKGSNSSEWEHTLIDKVWKETEILTDESYMIIDNIYKLRNFSAHPALNEDYELISPSPEMTVAYIKKALEDIFVRPSVFAQNIVNRMSDDIASKKDIYWKDTDAFQSFLNRVYFERMSEKMANQVFKAFWKFTFVKSEEDIYDDNRNINRTTLEFMMEYYGDLIVNYIKDNPNYFHVEQNSKCLTQVCVFLAFYPKVFNSLDRETQYQIENYDENNIDMVKWFLIGDLEKHINTYKSPTDRLPSILLRAFKKVCKMQAQPQLFNKLIIKHYSMSDSYTSARYRFDYVLSNYLSDYSVDDFVEIIKSINSNNQIYGYGWQQERNDKLLKYAKPVLPETFDFSDYPHFEYTEETEDISEESTEPNLEEEAEETLDES